ncbi:MAG: hypothetical protein U0Z17_06750 [Bacteroidales bacterium]
MKYNIQAANDYISGPWYNYMLLLAGLLIPPVSLMLLFGFFRIWEKAIVTISAGFSFPGFSFVLNKQERFILPFCLM